MTEMDYTPALAEQRFLLEHVVRIGELAAQPRYASATPDMVDAVLDGAGAFAARWFAPLNRVGDTVGAQWSPEGVTMPAGFREAYAAYVADGWGTIDRPEAFGGQGLPFSVATAALEDLATANMAFSLIMMLTPGAIEALVHHGSAEQQAAWLPRLVTGEWSGTMNLTEDRAGSDVGALTTSATPGDDGSWRIRGTKIFITFGEHDLTDNIVHLVLARTPGAPAGSKGISLFLVPKYRLDADGGPREPNDVRCLSIEHKMGIHGSPTCVMSYGEAGDCRGWLVGAEHDGMRAMFTMMNNARLGVGLQGVAVAERATQAAVGYARERVQSARAGGESRAPVAIIGHPDVRRMLLRMKALTQAARALVYYAAGQADRAAAGDPAARAKLDLLTPLAKAYGTDVGVEVASLGVQVHGGMGFIEETGAAQHYRDARIAPIYEGTNGIQAADLVGRKLLGDDGRALSDLLADIRAEASDDVGLSALAESVADLSGWMRDPATSTDDRLAGSYPFLTMVSVLTAGWLMARQQTALNRGGIEPSFRQAKAATVRFYLERIVPEALGLAAGVRAGAEGLYMLDEDAFAA